MKLNDVNTSNIRRAVELGCQTMSSVFDAGDNQIPFFGSLVRPVAFLAFNPVHSEAHVPGRHLNALLNAKDALGIAVPDEVIEKHARAAYFSYSGPVALPLNRENVGGPLINFAPHNIREGFHALYALLAFRYADKAHDLTEASIAAILDLWHPERGWNRAKLEGEWRLRIIDFDAPFIGGLARALGPLVKYYRVTNSGPALQLAQLLTEKICAEYFPEDGEFYFQKLGMHTHSITCVMSSLAQMAEVTRDAALMNRTRAFYDNGLKQIANPLGWSPESLHPNANFDRGEANNTGDILETALILARHGYPQYYQDAERILRGHLLPSQLRDVSWIREPENPKNEDGKRDMAKRHQGAFGFPAPYGHQPLGMNDISFNMDIVGGAVASLCEAYRATTIFDGRGHHVNLLMDHETQQIKVQSPYTADNTRGDLIITLKQAAPLWVRLPSWLKREEIEVIGAKALPRVINGFLYFPQVAPGELTLRFPLKLEELLLTYKTRQIRARLVGDQVRQMDNFGADLTFFEAIA